MAPTMKVFWPTPSSFGTGTRRRVSPNGGTEAPFQQIQEVGQLESARAHHTESTANRTQNDSEHQE
jgi:hypothetical protein